MHFKSIGTLFSLALISKTSLAGNALLAYDPAYDNGDTSLSAVACSDGPHGLESRGYKTLGSLPIFPNVGGAPAIAGWNSVNCGTCWQLTYVPDNGNKQTNITILAIDKGDGFVTGLRAMNALTGGRAQDLGKVNVTSQKVDSSKCGL